MTFSITSSSQAYLMTGQIQSPEHITFKSYNEKDSKFENARASALSVLMNRCYVITPTKYELLRHLVSRIFYGLLYFRNEKLCFSIDEKEQALKCFPSHNIENRGISFHYCNAKQPSDYLIFNLYDNKYFKLEGSYEDSFMTIDPEGNIKTKNPYIFNSNSSVKIINREDPSFSMSFSFHLLKIQSWLETSIYYHKVMERVLLQEIAARRAPHAHDFIPIFVISSREKLNLSPYRYLDLSNENQQIARQKIYQLLRNYVSNQPNQIPYLCSHQGGKIVVQLVEGGKICIRKEEDAEKKFPFNIYLEGNGALSSTFDSKCGPENVLKAFVEYLDYNLPYIHTYLNGQVTSYIGESSTSVIQKALDLHRQTDKNFSSIYFFSPLHPNDTTYTIEIETLSNTKIRIKLSKAAFRGSLGSGSNTRNLSITSNTQYPNLFEITFYSENESQFNRLSESFDCKLNLENKNNPVIISSKNENKEKDQTIVFSIFLTFHHLLNNPYTAYLDYYANRFCNQLGIEYSLEDFRRLFMHEMPKTSSTSPTGASYLGFHSDVTDFIHSHYPEFRKEPWMVSNATTTRKNDMNPEAFNGHPSFLLNESNKQGEFIS